MILYVNMLLNSAIFVFAYTTNKVVFLFFTSDLKVLYFYVEDSAECNQMTDVINELNKSDENKNVTFIKVILFLTYLQFLYMFIY